MKFDKVNDDYKIWFSELKTKIRSVQIKAALAANAELIRFYFDLGKSICEKENVWGANLIDQVSKDLKSEFPEMTGFSKSNLYYSKQFYVFYKDTIFQQAVGKIQSNINQLDNPIEQISQQPVDQI